MASYNLLNIDYFETCSFRMVDRTIEVGRYEKSGAPGERPSRCSGGNSF